MSSIEKFIDKLGKEPATNAESEQDSPSLFLGQVIQTGKTSSEVSINFERSSEQGLLTLD